MISRTEKVSEVFLPDVDIQRELNELNGIVNTL